MNKSDKETILEIKDLSVNYISTGNIISAVKKVSFYLEKNKMLGIIGETG